MTEVPRTQADGAGGPQVLGSWLGAGVSFAAVGWLVSSGPSLVFGALLMAPLPFVFSRLRRHAPGARTTSDLVGAVLGERVGVFTALIQLLAYLLIALSLARAYATGILALVRDPAAPSSDIWVTTGAIGVFVVAGILAALPVIRGIAWCVTIPAVIGALVFFYVALAVIASKLTGRAPDAGMPTSSTPASDLGFGVFLLGVMLISGMEVVTVPNRQVRSAGRSMGYALLLVGVVALTITSAVVIEPMGSTEFELVAIAYLGEAAAVWTALGGVALVWAALLVLLFGANRVARRLGEQLRLPAPNLIMASSAVAVVSVLAVAVFSPMIEAIWDYGGFADAGRILVLAVYTCAACACMRLDSAGSFTVIRAVGLYVVAVIAGVVMVISYGIEKAELSPVPLGVAALVVGAAAGFAFKTSRMPRIAESTVPAVD